MSVVLVRIDDRLIHGQVVEGWLKSVRVNHVAVASDFVAADETQKALYCLTVPHGVRLSCLSLKETAAAWESSRWKEDRVLVLAATPHDIVSLVELGARIPSVNVGGMHFREGRVQVLKAVSLDDKDVEAFRKLAARKIVLEVRPLPLDDPINLTTYLDRWQQDREALGEQPR